MKWKKINLDSPLKTGDVMGCGWIKEDTPDTKGLVYFTVNGTRIQQNFKDAPPNMYPFLHLQKKVTHSHVQCTCTCTIDRLGGIIM